MADLREAGQHHTEVVRPHVLSTKGVTLSRGLPAIRVNQATKPIAANDAAGNLWRRECKLLSPRRPLTKALMRPGFLVVLGELPQDPLQLAAAEDQEMVEDLAAYSPHPAFRKRRSPGGPDRVAGSRSRLRQRKRRRRCE